MRLWFLILFSQAAFCSDLPLKASFEKLPNQKGWTLCLTNISDRAILLGMEQNTSEKTVRLESTDTYSSNTVPAGPSVVRPMYIAEVIKKDGTVSRSGHSLHESVLDVQLTSQPKAFKLYPGDRITLRDGVLPELPKSASVKAAIYSGSKWDEITLLWRADT